MKFLAFCAPLVASTGLACTNVPEKYDDHADRYARDFGLDPDLFKALILVESCFRDTALSPAGAVGLGQLMPGTARALGVNPADPLDNLRGAAKYLRQMWNEFGSWDLALAAYNAGGGNVRRFGGIPPFRETRAHVRKVLERYAILKSRNPDAPVVQAPPRPNTAALAAKLRPPVPVAVRAAAPARPAVAARAAAPVRPAVALARPLASPTPPPAHVLATAVALPVADRRGTPARPAPVTAKAVPSRAVVAAVRPAPAPAAVPARAIVSATRPAPAPAAVPAARPAPAPAAVAAARPAPAPAVAPASASADAAAALAETARALLADPGWIEEVTALLAPAPDDGRAPSAVATTPRAPAPSASLFLVSRADTVAPPPAASVAAIPARPLALVSRAGATPPDPAVDTAVDASVSLYGAGAAPRAERASLVLFRAAANAPITDAPAGGPPAMP